MIQEPDKTPPRQNPIRMYFIKSVCNYYKFQKQKLFSKGKYCPLKQKCKNERTTHVIGFYPLIQTSAGRVFVLNGFCLTRVWLLSKAAHRVESDLDLVGFKHM